MTLLDAYLDAVRSLLPRAERSDIVAELRDALLSQIEDEQRAHGRALTDAELGAILQRFGSPDAVAARYTPPRYLIGPQVYPHYVFWAKVVMGPLGVMLLVLVALSLASDEPLRSIGRVLWTGTLIVLGNLAFVTLIFVLIERASRKLGGSASWDAREVPSSPWGSMGWWTLRPTRPARRTFIPRSDAIAGLGASVFWLVWWTDVVPINRWLLWNRLALEPAPIWDDLTPLALLVILGSLVTRAIALARPRAVLVYEIAGLLLGGGLLALAVRALAGGPLLVVTAPDSPAAPLAALLNTAGWAWLVVLAFIAIASIVVTIVRWIVQERSWGPASAA
jgi:hypothetical protein